MEVLTEFIVRNFVVEICSFDDVKLGSRLKWVYVDEKLEVERLGKYCADIFIAELFRTRINLISILFIMV